MTQILISDWLQHLVRRRAVTLLDYLCDLSPGEWADNVCDHMVSCLSDPNPGVVIAVVQTLSRHLTDQVGF